MNNELLKVFCESQRSYLKYCSYSLSRKTVYVLETNVSLKRSLCKKGKKCNIVEITVISSLAFRFGDNSCR